MSGTELSCWIVGIGLAYVGYLAWSEYRMHHPKKPKKPKLPGNNIKGPLR